jgi:hypothetical protein
LTSDGVAVGDGATTAPHAFEKYQPSRRRVWTLALAFGVAAGLVSWGAGELAHDYYKPKLFKVQVLLETFIQPTIDSLHDAEQKNAILAFTILGGVVGLAMGLAGGLVVRKPTRAVLVGLAAAAVGAFFAWLSSRALLPIHFRRLAPDPNDIAVPIMIHAGVWTDVGAVGGAAFAIGMGSLRSVPKALVGACVGALMATVVFHIVGGSFFPESGYIEPIAKTPWIRLLSRGLLTVLIAVGAARGAEGHVVPSPAPEPVH